MRGYYDELLFWPFKPTVSFQLLDTCKRAIPVMKATPSQPNNSSHMKPTSEMNPGFGWLFFCKQEDVGQYITASGCLYVRIIIHGDGVKFA